MNDSNVEKPKCKVKRVSVVPTNAPYPLLFSFSQRKQATSIQFPDNGECQTRTNEISQGASAVTFFDYESNSDDSIMQLGPQFNDTNLVIFANEKKRAGKDKNNSAAESEATKNETESVSNDYDILSMTFSLETDNENNNYTIITESSKTESNEDKTPDAVTDSKNELEYDSNIYNIRSMHAFTGTEKENNNINNVFGFSNTNAKNDNVSQKRDPGIENQETPTTSSNTEDTEDESVSEASSKPTVENKFSVKESKKERQKRLKKDKRDKLKTETTKVRQSSKMRNEYKTQLSSESVRGKRATRRSKRKKKLKKADPGTATPETADTITAISTITTITTVNDEDAVESSKTDSVKDKRHMSPSKAEAIIDEDVTKPSKTEVMKDEDVTEPSKTEAMKDEDVTQPPKKRKKIKYEDPIAASKTEATKVEHAIATSKTEATKIEHVTEPSKTEAMKDKPVLEPSETEPMKDKSVTQPSKTEAMKDKPVTPPSKAEAIKLKAAILASEPESTNLPGTSKSHQQHASPDSIKKIASKKETGSPQVIPTQKVKHEGLIHQFMTRLKNRVFGNNSRKPDDELSAPHEAKGIKDAQSSTKKETQTKPNEDAEPLRKQQINRAPTFMGQPRSYSSQLNKHRLFYDPKEMSPPEESDTFSFMNIPNQDEEDDEGLQVYFGERKFESRLEEQMYSVMKIFHSNFFEFYVKNQYSLVPCYIGITILKLLNVIIEHGIEVIFSNKQRKMSPSMFYSFIVLASVFGIELCIFTVVVLTDDYIKKKAIKSTVFRHSCPVILFIFDLFTVILCLHYYDKMQKQEYSGADNGWCVPTVFLNIVLLPCSVTTSSLLSVIVFAAHVMYNSINDTRLDFFDRFSKVSVVTWNYLCSFILGFAVKHLCQHTISHGYDECKRVYRRQEEILADTQRQEYLLKTILPPMVATEILKRINSASPSRELTLFKKPFMSKYADCSILFADVVGFTVISSNLKAKDLVSLLDVLFLRFDALSDKYDVLRIEIAGDCYIAVCGTEKVKTNHAQLMVRMAMGMVDVMGTVNDVLVTSGYKWNLNLRIGINSGDIVGGVVGRYRWRFDVVGRNVLLANQMESSGEPGKIHITEFTRRRLPNSFSCVQGRDHPFFYDSKTRVVKTFFVEFIDESLDAAIEQRRNLQARERVKEFNQQRQISLDHTVADIVHLEVYDKVAMNKLILKFDSDETENTFQKFCIKSSVHDLYLTSVVFGLRYCGSMMQVRIVDSLALGNCITFVVLLLLSSFSFLPHESAFIRYKYIRTVRRELYRNPAFRMFIIILIVVTTLINVLVNNASKFCKNLEKNLTESSSNEDKFNFATLCRSANDLHLVCIMHLISLQSSREWTIIGSVMVMVISYTLLLYLIRHSKFMDTQIVNVIVIESWIFAVILLIAFYVIKLEFRKTFAWRWNVQCSLFRAQWARQTNQALMRNIFPIHVATFFYYQEEGKVQYSQQHEMVAVMFASIMNAKDNLRLQSADDTLQWLQLLHSIIIEIDQFLDWPFLQPVTKMKTMGPMYMAASGLKDIGDHEKNSEALVAMCEFSLAIIDLIEDLNRKPDNMLHTRIGINIGPVYAGVICHHRPHYDIWGNTVNVASRMESHGVIGCVQITTRSMLILHRISNYNLVRRGKIEVKGKGEMVTYFVKRQSVGGDQKNIADFFL